MAEDVTQRIQGIDAWLSGRATPQQEFAESTGAADVFQPTKVKPTAQTLRRGILRAARKAGKPDVTIPELPEADYGGGTVEVPPTLPDETAKEVTKGVFKRMTEGPKGTQRYLYQTDKGEYRYGLFDDAGKMIKDMGKAPAKDIEGADGAPVPGRVKQAQSYVLSVIKNIYPEMDPWVAMSYAENPEMLDRLKPDVPADVISLFDNNLKILKEYYGVKESAPADKKPAGGKSDDPFGFYGKAD